VKTLIYNVKSGALILIFLLLSNALGARNARDTLGVGVPVLFSENKGQWEERVLFRSQMRGATLFAERDCFTLVLQHPGNGNLRHPELPGKGGERYRTHAYRLRFEGCKEASVKGEGEQAGYENYFVGRDQTRWASHVKTYNTVIYKGLYDGVDMRVYAAEKGMKYDFIVSPKGDATKIAMQYEGVDGVKIRDGNLVIHTSVMDVVELKPYAYQTVGEKEVEVVAEYVVERGRVVFKLGAYDHTLPLVIDPYLHFSTYTGSTADNWGTTACYDSYKNTYSSGLVFATGYPVSLGAYDGTYNGNADIGIFKFDTSGSQRLWATYLGGSNADMPHSMYVNSFDELVVFGTTGSMDFPVTPEAFDTSFNGGSLLRYEGSSTINFPNGVDIFISRFSGDGDQLQASTYVGGSGNDGLNYRHSFSQTTVMIGNDSLYFNYGDGARGEIITDDLNNIYVGSTTFSTDFPVTEGCIQPASGGRQDGVVFKIDYNLSHLIWSTYIGGTKDDAVYSIDCDGDYNVVVTGGTNSYNFPTTTGSYRTFYTGGSADAFVSKISYYGKTLMASTYYGSTSYDQSYFVRCAKQGDIFIFGQTKAAGATLIHNANYNTPNSGQFLARLNTTLDTLRWSSVFGDGSGEPNISPTAFAVDICNRIYLSGWGRVFLGLNWGTVYYPWYTHGTTSLPVTSDAWQSTTDGQDFYLMSLDMEGNNLVYATYIGELHDASGSYYHGSDHVDGGTSRFDRLGTLYQAVCASCSQGDEFPVTTGAWSEHNNSNNCNNAIFRLNLTDDFPVAEYNYTRSSNCNPTYINFHNTGRGTSYLWDFGDGTTSTVTDPTHQYTTPGVYTVRLTAYMPGGCRDSDIYEREITIVSNQNDSQNFAYLDTLHTCPGTPVQIGLHPEQGLSYTWTQGAVSDSNIANPMAEQAGTYILYVTSTYPCTTRFEQVILPGEADARIVGDSIYCSVPDTLDIEAAGTGITYVWSSDRTMSDTLNQDLGDGMLVFTPHDGQWLYMSVVDAKGCYKNDSIQVHFTKVVDTLHIINPRCPGDCTGAAFVLATGDAMAPYSYKWEHQGGGWSTSDSSVGLCDGEYTVIFRDARGCTVWNEFTVNDPETPTVYAMVQHIPCLDSCTGGITVSVSGPSTYSLLWLDDSSTSATRNDLCAGKYHLEITDSNGCVFRDTIEVLENYDMSISISGVRVSCADVCSGKALATASGGTPPYSYYWSNGEQWADARELCEGTAVVVAVDQNGCSVSDSVVIGKQNSFDSIEVWADAEYVFSGHSTTLHVTEIEGASYWWSPSTMLNNASSANPVATVTDSTTFVVTVTDTLGCTYSDSLRLACITVECGKPNVFIPNAFTPNGDGKNDMVCFSGEWISDFHIAIFTRWGEKVYESDDIGACWDGRYHDNLCMAGVYVYHCRIRCADGQVTQLKGDITLIR